MEVKASTKREPSEPRKRILARKSALWTERSSWLDQWRDISKYQQPVLGRFLASDTGRNKRHNNPLDDTAVRASKTLAAGLMSGATSPARPWFALALRDKELMEFPPVKQYLHDVALLLRAIFASSNTYRTLHTLYWEMGLFGTGVDILLDDFDNVIHHYPLTAGEYALAVDAKGNVNTICRDYRMTVGQVVERFGKENCSRSVRDAFDKGNFDNWVDVIHMIEPRRDRDASKKDALNMPFRSCYIEAARSDDNRMLGESGYREFPALCPRWVVAPNDAYGSSPGMDCMGAVKRLNHAHLRKGEAIDYQVRPPIVVPPDYKDAKSARLPGGVFYGSTVGGVSSIRSAWDVNVNLSHLGEDIRDVRESIRQAYYVDLFLMLANDTRSGTTAYEVAERHEEKLLMLGPVLERLHNEMLSPLIDRTYAICDRAGILPEAPQELEGTEIVVEFISVLAQAQRAVATQGTDRLLAVVGQMAQAKPEVIDKLDFDQVVDVYAEAYGIDPKIVMSDEAVAGIRDQRAQQQQAAAAAAAAPVAADTAKTIGEIDPQGVNDVMNGLMGYSTPSPAQV